jgi:hypothetical protein
MVAIAEGLFGVAIRIASMFTSDSKHDFIFYFGGGLIFVLIYIVVLFRLKDRWKAGVAK